MNSIPKVAERMKMLYFKLQFPDKLYNAKPDVRMAFTALRQLRESGKMFGMLEVCIFFFYWIKINNFVQMVLILGNFINDGTFRGNASGFKIDGLVKMADTKSSKKPKTNLIHYLVELVESIRPDLLDFPTELETVIKAATSMLIVGLVSLSSRLPLLQFLGQPLPLIFVN